MSALNRILQTQLPAENKRLRSLYPQAPAIQVDVIYTDQGPEFGKVWQDYLTQHKIRAVMFKATEGTKRRMGVVERMMRTLRRYYAVYVHNHPKGSKWHGDVFPQVLIQYNYKTNQRMLRAFFHRNLGHKKHFPREYGKMVFTPAFMMSQPKFEQEWINWKAERTQKVDQQYQTTIKKLQKQPEVRYRKTLDQGGKKVSHFQKAGSGTLSTWTPTYGQHTYVNKGKRTQRESAGKSFVVGEDGLRLLPYDLIIK